MRWWKTFREDLDRPAFQAGIERFGTCFLHDVARAWQLICSEEGPGLREVPLTKETLSVLARQFRVASPKEARERLEFMAAWRLIELRPPARGRARSMVKQNGSVREVIASAELKRRRDDWTARKLREKKRHSERVNSGVAPKLLQRNFGTEAEVEAEANAEAEAEA
jgi:hypothetical protein